MARQEVRRHLNRKALHPSAVCERERLETIKKRREEEKEREMSDSTAFDGIAEGAKRGGSTHRYRENESRDATDAGERA